MENLIIPVHPTSWGTLGLAIPSNLNIPVPQNKLPRFGRIRPFGPSGTNYAVVFTYFYLFICESESESERSTGPLVVHLTPGSENPKPAAAVLPTLPQRRSNVEIPLINVVFSTFSQRWIDVECYFGYNIAFMRSCLSVVCLSVVTKRL